MLAIHIIHYFSNTLVFLCLYSPACFFFFFFSIYHFLQIPSIMFSFRRKSKKEQDSVRNSPSLPELSSQGIPWPENLVDVKEIRDLPQPTTQSATKPSFQGSIRSAIPFHKPFRNASGGRVAAKTAGAPISAMYMTSPPSAFDNRANGTGRQYSQRRSRVPPTFNLMVRTPILLFFRWLIPLTNNFCPPSLCA